MKQPAYFVLSLAIAFNSVLLVWGSPSFSIGGFKFGSDTSYENEYESVNSKVYNVITSLGEKKGQCMRHIRVTGNGIGDTFNTPCSGNGIVSTISDKVLIYGNPKEEFFFLFSDEPSNLIVFHNGKCTKRKYKTVNKKTSQDTTELSEDECNLIQNNIMFIESQESKYLLALDKHYDERELAKYKNVNFGKSYKSVSKSQQNGARAHNSKPSKPAKAAAKAQDLPTNPLGQYAQFQQATNAQPNNLESVSETHQKIPHNGITVTEQVTTSTDTDSSLTTRTNTNVEASEANQDSTSSTHHHSYLEYLEAKYQQLKSELAQHLTSHKSS